MPALIYALDDEIKPFLKKNRGGSPLLLCRCGIGMGNAHEATENLIDTHHPDFIVSAGYAGGLREGLKSGDIVLPTEIRCESPDRFQPEPVLRDRLKNAIQKLKLPFHEGALLTVFNPLKLPEQKKEAGKKGAMAVDLETAAIAAVCSKKSVPFVALRVVFDPVEMEAPEFEPKKVIRNSFFRIPKLIRMNRRCQQHLAAVIGRFLVSQLRNFGEA
ncbi:MAG: hypothetical protein HYY44_03120 [Deltaproteobacteria bacterium]|nr:hypothetical protein [Deltaproteobacteria bacterium]MBI4374181.1 hypothetical protein [Deltaproteobacteria bacterium]